MTISIIIPVYNEAQIIGKLLDHLKRHGGIHVVELIVCDGGSTDDTIAVAEAAGAIVRKSPVAGRASQMNFGAAAAVGDVLYFVHADSFPPVTFASDILNAINKGYDLGRYRSSFDSKSWLLKLNAWLTRFDFFMCMGGDQTLFIRHQLFNIYQGFNGSMRIMEEYEFCERVRKTGRYIILAGEVKISARKYDTNSWLRVQLANATIIKMYKRGAAQQAMIHKYKQMLDYRKNPFTNK